MFYFKAIKNLMCENLILEIKKKLDLITKHQD